MFKIKERFKLELQTPTTMLLFTSAKELIDKTKIGKNVSSLEMVKVVLVQFNLVDNQYLQKSEVLFTLTPNKSYAYLILSEKPRNLMFLKTFNIQFLMLP